MAPQIFLKVLIKYILTNLNIDLEPCLENPSVLTRVLKSVEVVNTHVELPRRHRSTSDAFSLVHSETQFFFNV